MGNLRKAIELLLQISVREPFIVKHADINKVVRLLTKAYAEFVDGGLDEELDD